MDTDRYDQLVQEFLSKKRIATWGVEDAKGDPGQMVVRKFRKQGVKVIAVNPNYLVYYPANKCTYLGDV